PSGQGKVDAILCLGGSAGTTIGAAAMRALSFGIPKVMVSTLASGQVKPYVGVRDILMMPSVVDISGLNRISRTVLTNAAHAMIGMVRQAPRARPLGLGGKNTSNPAGFWGSPPGLRGFPKKPGKRRPRKCFFFPPRPR